MEPAVLGVVLDSSVVIEAERRRLDVAGFLKYVVSQIGEREAALSAISVANSPMAFTAPTSPDRRQMRRAFLDDLKAIVTVYPVTGETAELAGRISAESSRRFEHPVGRPVHRGLCAGTRLCDSDPQPPPFRKDSRTTAG